MLSKSEIYAQIKQIERDIEQIKSLHNFGRIDVADARTEIKELNADLMNLVNQLPEYDRHMYLIKKEFGNDGI